MGDWGASVPGIPENKEGKKQQDVEQKAKEQMGNLDWDSKEKDGGDKKKIVGKKVPVGAGLAPDDDEGDAESKGYDPKDPAIIKALDKLELDDKKKKKDKELDDKAKDENQKAKIKKFEDTKNALAKKEKEAKKDASKKDAKKAKKKKAGKHLSRSARAGVQFPVGRLHRYMKPYVPAGCRISGHAAIYTASILEYLTAEVLELAGNSCMELKKKSITPRHLKLAIRGDDELDGLIKATIAGGGVIPTADKSFLTKKGKLTKKTGKPGKVVDDEEKQPKHKAKFDKLKNPPSYGRKQGF